MISLNHDLKPCPFCGKDPYLYDVRFHCNSSPKDGPYSSYTTACSTHWMVKCDHCGIEMAEEFRETTIAAWNTRVTSGGES